MTHHLETTRSVNHRDVQRRASQQDRPRASSPCPNRAIVRIVGNPSAGTITLRQGSLIDDVDSEIQYDATSFEVEAALEAANGYDGYGNGYDITCTGGPLPHNAIIVQMPSGMNLSTVLDDLTDPSYDAYSEVIPCCGDST